MCCHSLSSVRIDGILNLKNLYRIGNRRFKGPLAYFSLDELEKLTENGIYWISRLKANSYLADENGQRIDLEKMLKAAQEDTYIRKSIRIGKRKQLRVYLIAERLSEAETNKRRRSIRYRAKRKAQTPSKTLLRLAGYNLYITNIEEHRLTPKQICVIIGIRWQIELMFKCFKSIGKLRRHGWHQTLYASHPASVHHARCLR